MYMYLDGTFSLQANTIDPTNVESLLLKGLTLLEVKKAQEAILHYQSAVRLAPQRFEAYKGNNHITGILLPNYEKSSSYTKRH